MTNATISKIIRWLNRGNHADRVFTRQLSDNVTKGFVWPRLPNGEIDRRGYEFFFVYDESSLCVAAVLDMDGSDLHAYVRPMLRRKGIMSRALREVILPHLASQGRSIQNVTLRSKAGEHLARAVGFTVNTEGNGASIDLTKSYGARSMANLCIPLSKSQLSSIERRLRHAEQLLEMVEHEITLACTQESSKVAELSELIEYLRDFRRFTLRD